MYVKKTCRDAVVDVTAAARRSMKKQNRQRGKG
jgi:hypothetical protein